MLQCDAEYVAVHCNVEHVKKHCSCAPHSAAAAAAAVYGRGLLPFKCMAEGCRLLRDVAVYYFVAAAARLQPQCCAKIALCCRRCSILQCRVGGEAIAHPTIAHVCRNVCRNVLQFVAVICIVLQCVVLQCVTIAQTTIAH